MRPQINKLLPFVLIVIITSCGTALNGSIETREGNKVYIVNTSENNAFKFTLKTESITDDSIHNYRTDIIELAPGDERYIGLINELIIQEPPSDNMVVDTAVKYKSVDDLPDLAKENPPLPEGYTVIPPKKTKIKYTYKVTGQLKINSLSVQKAKR